MGADRHGADGQRRRCFHDRAHEVGLVLELAALPRGQLAQRLDGDGELPARPALVPHAADHTVDDYLCEKYGDLGETPLTIRIEGSRLKEAHSKNKELEEEFWRYCHTDENSDRVGEFAIGTNIELKDVIGQILQDEKFPGVHIAFGNPYGAHTGAEWYSSTHIDVVGRHFDIWVDDEQIMRSGKFLVEA